MNFAKNWRIFAKILIFLPIFIICKKCACATTIKNDNIYIEPGWESRFGVVAGPHTFGAKHRNPRDFHVFAP